MTLFYQHKTPEYMPLSEDMQMLPTVGSGLNIMINEGKWVGEIDELDWFGQNWKYEPTVRAYNPDATNYIVKDVTKWRDYVTLPDVDAVDWKAKFDATEFKRDENKLLEIRDSVGVWERAFSMIGTSDLLGGLILEPEAMADFFSTITDHKIKLYNYYVDYYKPDVFCMNDDYGHGHGLFMSPDTWRKLIKPNLQRIIDNFKAQGVMYEHHCCGYLVPLVEEIAEMGAVSWNSVHFCNNPPDCKERFGDIIAFMGGSMNAAFMDAPDTTVDQIRSHVREMTGKMLPGAIVMSGGAPSHPDRSPIIYEELVNSGQQYFKQKRPTA